LGATPQGLIETWATLTANAGGSPAMGAWLIKNAPLCRCLPSRRLPFRKIMLNQEYDSFRQAHPELLWREDAPETMVSVMPSIDCREFFIRGASAGRSQYCFGGTHSITKSVKRT
jgi:hypothetical protein